MSALISGSTNRQTKQTVRRDQLLAWFNIFIQTEQKQVVILSWRQLRNVVLLCILLKEHVFYSSAKYRTSLGCLCLSFIILWAIIILWVNKSKKVQLTMIFYHQLVIDQKEGKTISRQESRWILEGELNIRNWLTKAQGRKPENVKCYRALQSQETSLMSSASQPVFGRHWNGRNEIEIVVLRRNDKHYRISM